MMEYYGSRSTNREQYTLLNHCIEEILSFIKPFESDRQIRLNTINELAISIQSDPNLQGVTVQPFGSFVSNLYSKWGDLDISINLNNESTTHTGKERKTTVLRQIRNILQRRGIGQIIQFIPQARVPLLNYESNLYGISCDLSVQNRQGYVKSKIQLMTSLDERFTDMVLLTCEPAILPPVKEIYDGNISDDVEGMEFKSENQIVDACGSKIQKIIISNIFTLKNQSSLSELLVSFFDKYSEIGAIASGYAICPFTGRWEKITNNPNWTQNKIHNLFIEDPFEQPDNSARSVWTYGLKTISNAFRLACQTLSPPSRSLSDRNALLYLLSHPLVSSKLSQLNNANIINMSRNHVSNNNRAGYSYSNKSSGRVDPNLNLSRGITGIAPTIGLAERVRNGSHNNRSSSSNQYLDFDFDENPNWLDEELNLEENADWLELEEELNREENADWLEVDEGLNLEEDWEEDERWS